jgi:hypothetical protein
MSWAELKGMDEIETWQTQRLCRNIQYHQVNLMLINGSAKGIP